jgi:hypothetical protein
MGRVSNWLAVGTICSALIVGCDGSHPASKTGSSPKMQAEPVIQLSDDARTIITKAIKAHGGDKAISRWRCGEVRYRAGGAAIPLEGVETTMEETFQFPGHFKRVVRMSAGGQTTVQIFVNSDGKVWIKKGDGATEVRDNDFANRTEHLFANFVSFIRINESEAQFVKLDEAAIHNHVAVGVRAKFEQTPPIDLFFDKQTGLLVHSKQIAPKSGRDEPVQLEAYLDDYREVQGGMVPMRMWNLQDGKKLTDVTIIELKFRDQFEESTFAKP